MELSPNDLMRAVNNTEREFDINGTKFAPGQSRVVTFLWMVNNYGDPRSIQDRYQVIRLPNGESMGVQARQGEVMRVQKAWNVGPGKDHRDWEDIPPIEFYNMETEERIFTPFDDPTGSHSEHANITVDDNFQQKAKIDLLERQIAQLRQLSGLDEDAFPSDTANIPVDDSTAEGTQSPWAHSESPGRDLIKEAILRDE